MADVQILAPGVEAAPLDYAVPPTSEILLRAAGATFDGTGAAGAFLPAIVITPPSGVPLPPFITDTAVAAGSSAEVVFAPFLRHAPTSSASGLATAYARAVGTFTLGVGIGFTSFDSNDLAVFSTSTFAAPAVASNAAADNNLLCLGAGVYLVHLTANINMTAGKYRSVSLAGGVAGTPPALDLHGLTPLNYDTRSVVAGGQLWLQDTVMFRLFNTASVVVTPAPLFEVNPVSCSVYIAAYYFGMTEAANIY